MGGLSADMLNDFVTDNYTAGRIVVAGAGMEHRELVSLAEPLFSGLPSSGKAQQPSTKYLGGDFRWATPPSPPLPGLPLAAMRSSLSLFTSRGSSSGLPPPPHPSPSTPSLAHLP